MARPIGRSFQRGRTCTRCGVDRWYTNPTTGRSTCHPCKLGNQLQYIRARAETNRSRVRAHRAANVARYREAELMRTFGLTLHQYSSMLAEQGGVCAICACPETAIGHGGRVKHLAVDHDHNSGTLRGLLCSRCNLTIGRVEEDPGILLQMVAYLQRHKAGVAA